VAVVIDQASARLTTRRWAQMADVEAGNPDNLAKEKT
jgi:hypothetical protein